MRDVKNQKTLRKICDLADINGMESMRNVFEVLGTYKCLRLASMLTYQYRF